MPVHDAYPRLTPYEISFPEAWAQERFARLRQEIVTQDVDAGDPGLFVLLGAAAQMIREIRPPEEAPEHLPPHGLLLYHAFHFWAAGEPLLLVEAPAVRRLVEASPAARWDGRPPLPAGYFQLPQHLVWTEGAEGGAPPESVDGFFWTAPQGRPELHVLLAAGLRGDRPGFSVVPLPAVPLEGAESWAGVQAREGGGDYQSRMPGAELEGLYQIATPGEVLKLLARLFALLGQRAAEDPRPPPGEAGPPEPSRLPYRRVGP